MNSNKKYVVQPVDLPVNAVIEVPGSKSITQRAMITAALANGESRLEGALKSEDTELLADALTKLGVDVAWIDSGLRMKNSGVVGPGGDFQQPLELYMGNNGTGIRLLASLVCLGAGHYLLTGTKRMEERPIAPLLQALRPWGAKISCVKGTNAPPVLVDADGLAGGDTVIDGSLSSQYISSLLLVAPYLKAHGRICVKGNLVSRPYVDITLAVMRSFGVGVEETVWQDMPCFEVQPGAYNAMHYAVEGDASSASYFWAAAAVTGGKVTVSNIPPNALQGDVAFADILGRMGCDVTKSENGVTVSGPEAGRLKGIDIDMSKWPDVAPTLAVVAAFARSTTRISGVHHLRIKETDRIAAVATELQRMGAVVHELEDGLIIEGGVPFHGAEIETYNDHRMAMAFAVAGLKVPGVVISNPDCVVKSFPDFWEKWVKMTI
ncbi:MAG: 3-phosphoshikimate 1-carboxyvinyltransferase [Dissulfuribacterales bacterium]